MVPVWLSCSFFFTASILDFLLNTFLSGMIVGVTTGRPMAAVEMRLTRGTRFGLLGASYGFNPWLLGPFFIEIVFLFSVVSLNY